jgi:hypothetical protein
MIAMVGKLRESSAVVRYRPLLGVAVALTVGCGSQSNHASAKTEESAGTIVRQFKSDGLPIKQIVVYNATTNPDRLLGRPGAYTGKASFVDRRLHDSASEPGDV